MCVWSAVTASPVAIDARTGEIVLADKDPRVVLEKAKGRDHVVVRGRVHTRMSRSTSVLADAQPLPWLYPYREDPQPTRLGEPVFRPFVQISLANGGESTTLLDGLIDTGADAILASDLLVAPASPRRRAPRVSRVGGSSRLHAGLAPSAPAPSPGPRTPGSPRTSASPAPRLQKCAAGVSTLLRVVKAKAGMCETDRLLRGGQA